MATNYSMVLEIKKTDANIYNNKQSFTIKNNYTNF